MCVINFGLQSVSGVSEPPEKKACYEYHTPVLKLGMNLGMKCVHE